MFQVYEKETGTKVEHPTPFLLLAQQMAMRHRRETGNHCYVMQTTMVWATTQLSELEIEEGPL